MMLFPNPGAVADLSPIWIFTPFPPLKTSTWSTFPPSRLTFDCTETDGPFGSKLAVADLPEAFDENLTWTDILCMVWISLSCWKITGMFRLRLVVAWTQITGLFHTFYTFLHCWLSHVRLFQLRLRYSTSMHRCALLTRYRFETSATYLRLRHGYTNPASSMWLLPAGM